MNTIFLNSENSKTPTPNAFVLKLTNKLDSRRLLLYQILAFITREKT